jgi:predicted AAA+ superfamily ATPase
MKKFIYKRTIYKHIEKWLFKGKIIILYGPRQVGKTTLVKQMMENYPDSYYLNCERQAVKDLLSSANPEKILRLAGDVRIIFFDEAQKVKNIGEILKLLIDNYPEIQYIATGSSSFQLANKISEPLTGRNLKFFLFPLSLKELSQQYDLLKLQEKLPDLLRFGTYPDIVDRNEEEQMTLLDELTSDYLFRDILQFENIKHSEVLVKLLKAIALQLGNEVSYRELATLIGISVETVQRYLQLLEKSFVLFSLPSFSRNLRNEISRSRKYYFYDLGIRNSIIQNYAILENRTDKGALWENFCIVSRMHLHADAGKRTNLYFWRTYQQKEIDLIEEYGGRLKAFEFKFSNRKVKPPVQFMNAYPDTTFQVVHKENFIDFLM